MSGPVAILCSGQGAQHPGMFDLVAEVPDAQAIFAAAAKALGEDPRRYVRNAAPADLYSNRSGQILCCTQALAAWAALGTDRPKRAIIAGYSVGELAAWGCGGMFDATQLLMIAERRAQIMDAAAPNDGGLAGIIGLTRATLEPMLEPMLAARKAYIAIINGLDSFVVGGHRPDLEAICEEATDHGARRAVLIQVAVPSHTPYLADASPKFAQILKAAAPVMPPYGYRVLAGVDGGAFWDLDEAIGKLASQISRSVDWAACLDSCRSAGAEVALELGPGNALCRIAADWFPAGAARSVDDFRSLAGLKSWLRRAMDA